MDKFRQGLLGMMSDPLFQAGVGLLGRTDMPFGQALGGTMNDMAAQQMLQQRFKAQQQQEQQRQQAEAWYQQAGMGGVPHDVRQQMLQRMFAAPQAPKTSGGMEWNPTTGQWSPIPGWKASMQINTAPTQMPTDEQIRADDAKAFAELDRKYVTGLSENASSARSNMGSYRRALSLLDTVNTGSLEATKVEAKKLANAFGVDVDLSKIANAEELQVFLGDQLMARVAQTKGAVSNKEMELFERFSASFGKTTQGNKQILKFKIAQAERDIKLQQMAYQMRKDKKTASEIRLAIERYIDENDLSGLLTPPSGAATGQSQSQAVTADGRTIEQLLEQYQ